MGNSIIILLHPDGEGGEEKKKLKERGSIQGREKERRGTDATVFVRFLRKRRGRKKGKHRRGGKRGEKRRGDSSPLFFEKQGELRLGERRKEGKQYRGEKDGHLSSAHTSLITRERRGKEGKKLRGQESE